MPFPPTADALPGCRANVVAGSGGNGPVIQPKVTLAKKTTRVKLNISNHRT
jgi:hypothetical protein